jgi:hypothetical protein
MALSLSLFQWDSVSGIQYISVSAMHYLQTSGIEARLSRPFALHNKWA